jgi:hypothetical protein
MSAAYKCCSVEFLHMDKHVRFFTLLLILVCCLHFRYGTVPYLNPSSLPLPPPVQHIVSSKAEQHVVCSKRHLVYLTAVVEHIVCWMAEAAWTEPRIAVVESMGPIRADWTGPGTAGSGNVQCKPLSQLKSENLPKNHFERVEISKVTAGDDWNW